MTLVVSGCDGSVHKSASCQCIAVGILDGLDEDEILNKCQNGGVERFAEKFPM